MKYLGLFLICLFCFCTRTEAKERVIQRPPFIAWSSDVLEIDKIVLNDTATILHVKAFFEPKYWIKIQSGAYLLGDNGNKYMLRGVRGITLDKEFLIPESGEIAFQMVFPRMDDTVSSVSFFERNDAMESWKIWGIRLKGKHPKLTLPKSVTSKKTVVQDTLPEPVLKKGNALLKGKLLDFMPGMDNRMIFYTTSAFGESYEEIELKVEDDGSFSKEIPVVSVTPGVIHVFNSSINLYLAPGEETTLYINIREVCRSASRLRTKEKPRGKRVYYENYLAGLSTELEESSINTQIISDFHTFIDEIENRSMEEVKNVLLEKHKKIIKDIDMSKLSGAAKEVLKGMADNSVVYHICFTGALVKQAHAVSNKLTDEETAEYVSRPVYEPTGFYNVLKYFPRLNKPQVLYTNNYSFLFGASNFNKVYSQAIGTDKGTYFDLYKMHKVLRSISDYTPLTDRQISILKELHSPVYLELAEEKNAKLVEMIEENKKKAGFKSNLTVEAEAEDLFPYLVSRFRGRVVLVDFWATWCGPCLMANKIMKPMKEDMKHKDVVYLYVAGENSPESDWNTMIPNIPGEHFRLKNEQWEYLCKQFNISAIPVYLIVDRKGNVAYQKKGFPGNDIIKKELDKILTKE